MNDTKGCITEIVTDGSVSALFVEAPWMGKYILLEDEWFSIDSLIELYKIDLNDEED